MTDQPSKQKCANTECDEWDDENPPTQAVNECPICGAEPFYGGFDSPQEMYGLDPQEEKDED